MYNSSEISAPSHLQVEHDGKNHNIEHNFSFIEMVFFPQFGRDMNEYFQRADIWGKIARQILNPPMAVQRFDKSKGRIWKALML